MIHAPCNRSPEYSALDCRQFPPKLVCSFSSLGMLTTILHAFIRIHKCLCQALCVFRKSGSSSLKAVYLTQVPRAGTWKQKCPQLGKNAQKWQRNADAKSLQSCPTVRPHRRQPTRLPHPWDSPGKNTGVGCNFLLLTEEQEGVSFLLGVVVQSLSHVQHCSPKNCSPLGSSVRGISPAGILDWFTTLVSRGSSWLKDWTWVSGIGRWIALSLGHQGSLYH